MKSTLVLIIIGIAIAVVVAISWFAFPSWRQTQGGFWTLLVAAATGVVTIAKGIFDVLKGARGLGRKDNHDFLSPSINSIGSESQSIAISRNVYEPITFTDNYIKISRDSTVQASQEESVPQSHLLPTSLPDFTGRINEIHNLKQTLSRPEAPNLFSISGMGGVGKTALAIHVANDLLEVYPDARIMVDMKGSQDDPLTSEQAMLKVVRAFRPETPPSEDSDETADLYRSTLYSKRALILLDDVSGTAQVRDLVPPPTCGLILTSRRTLNLPGMTCLNLSQMSQEETRELLIGIIGEKRATTEQLYRIGELCGQLPLALRVAGDFLKIHRDWSAKEYIETLVNERERLTRLRHEDLNVEAVLGLSAARLVEKNPEAAAKWQMLSVFPAPFRRPAAAAIWNVDEETALDELSALYGLSLLLYDFKDECYRIHELMRRIASDVFEYSNHKQDRERKQERLKRAALRHAHYYLEEGHRANELYQNGKVMQGLDLFDAVWPHLAAAWERMVNRQDEVADRWLSDFSIQMIELLDLRLLPRKRLAFLEEGLAAARRLDDLENEGVQLANLGSAYIDLGETDEAIACHEQALDIARDIGEQVGECGILSNLGIVYDSLGNVEKAISYYEQALDITQEIDEPKIEGSPLGNLGNAYFSLGRIEKAIVCYEQALEKSRQAGMLREEGIWLGNLGNTHRVLGDLQKAISYLEQALAIAREIEDRRMEGLSLSNLGDTYVNLGEIHKSVDYYEQALAIGRKINDRRINALILGNLGNSHFVLGKLQEAIDHLEQALVLTRETGNLRGEGIQLGNLGLVYASRGQVQKSIDYFEQARDIAHETGDRRSEAASLGNLGNAYRRLGKMSEAINYTERALAIAREIGIRRVEGMQLSNLGIIYAELGELQKAIRYHKRALSMFDRIGDRRSKGMSLGNLGNVYTDLAETQKAISYYEEALSIFRLIRDRHNEGEWVGHLGIAYAELNEVQKAIDCYERARFIKHEAGDLHNEGAWLSHLGNIHLDLGALQKAMAYQEQSLSIFRQIGNRHGEAIALTNLGRIAERQKNLALTRELWEEALGIYEAIEDPRAEVVRGWLEKLG
jgi:tetratricopeptide (TPR) repeat protein